MVKTNWHGLGISVFACLSENQRLFGRRTELGLCQRIVKGFAELPEMSSDYLRMLIKVAYILNSIV